MANGYWWKPAVGGIFRGCRQNALGGQFGWHLLRYKVMTRIVKCSHDEQQLSAYFSDPLAYPDAF